jgi:hypothetical protein
MVYISPNDNISLIFSKKQGYSDVKLLIMQWRWMLGWVKVVRVLWQTKVNTNNWLAGWFICPLLFLTLHASFGYGPAKEVWRLILLCLMWCIWKEWNAWDFEDVETSMVEIRKCLLNMLYIWIYALAMWVSYGSSLLDSLWPKILTKGLLFFHHYHLKIEAYIDADWVGSIMDR